MEQLLESIGLSGLQAKIYLELLHQPSGRKPLEIAETMGITRTNAYKLLDQLCELGLAYRSDTRKVYRYFAEDPISLTSLSAKARNETIRLEKGVSEAISKLRRPYLNKISHIAVHSSQGKASIIDAFIAQSKTSKPVYFVKSRADVPFMGFETMHKIRTLGRTVNQCRYGITPDTPDAPSNKHIDEIANLERTHFPATMYTAPVEWTVSGKELAIICYEGPGKVIRIKDALVADAFTQMWQLLNCQIRANPAYTTMPQKAARQI